MIDVCIREEESPNSRGGELTKARARESDNTTTEKGAPTDSREHCSQGRRLAL